MATLQFRLLEYSFMPIGNCLPSKSKPIPRIGSERFVFITHRQFLRKLPF